MEVLIVGESATEMSKRIYLTLPDSVYADMERWAEIEGRPVANLANYLVEKAVKDAKASGELPPAKEGRK